MIHRSRATGLLAALALAVAPAAAQPGPNLVVHYTPLANLTYQLDCVSGVRIQCSRENLRALWDREFLRTAQDSARLADWARIRGRYEAEVSPAADEGAVPLPLAGRYEGVYLAERMRVAGFQATSAADYGERIQLLALADDAARLRGLVDYFLPRFDGWWQREAAAAGAPFAMRVSELMRDPRIAGRIAEFARFYGVQFAPGETIDFTLLYRPSLVDEGTSGQQIGARSLVEFVAGEQPEGRMDVVIHELCHYLFSRLPRERLAALEAGFVARAAAGQASAPAAYNLLDESLASTLGNGLVIRAFMTPAAYDSMLAKQGSLYANPLIDGAAKATLRWIEPWLAEGRPIDDPAFAPRYVAALDTAFGARLQTPAAYLNHMVGVVDRFDRSLQRAVRRIFRPSSSYTGESACCDAAALSDYRSKPGLNALIVVLPEHLAALAEQGVISRVQMDEIQTRVRADGGAVYAFRRSSTAFTYIVAAPASDRAEALLRQLAAAPALFEGFLPAQR
ncbi:hypothetical protein [Longimicrobium terrae]|uniref:DUF4932 domain-containing protein n=1 Tax=Longimicrobium terrae TaxID=1639882 RepID=A0A841GYM2_9BACT|nr:hypothetical protein [Longimicrobium terrae]MBB4636624.1 hypothetical protein [Longimicrobium terrae]MBB6070852.1 hypothetical protein [Longimicrobium terrae]NNC28878.1 hypothetical protein [Longimicrobium terrae]